jgi:hypothetical protein
LTPAAVQPAARGRAPQTARSPKTETPRSTFSGRSGRFIKRSHRRATLPPGKPGSTIAEAGLNFRVRNGNGCGPCSMNGGIKFSSAAQTKRRRPMKQLNDFFFCEPRASSRACCGRVVKPHGRLVLVSSTCYHASTSSLSNSSSRSALEWTCVQGKSHLEAGFPLRCFQRLSDPNVATQLCSWRNNWFTRGSSIPVLSY